MGACSGYSAVSAVSATVPWSYFVLSPISTVTQVATDQVRYSLMSAGKWTRGR